MSCDTIVGCLYETGPCNQPVYSNDDNNGNLYKGFELLTEGLPVIRGIHGPLYIDTVRMSDTMPPHNTNICTNN